jgi:hypothetical protein
MPATGAKLVAEAKKQCLPELTQSLLPKQGSYACQIDARHNEVQKASEWWWQLCCAALAVRSLNVILRKI